MHYELRDVARLLDTLSKYHIPTSVRRLLYKVPSTYTTAAMLCLHHSCTRVQSYYSSTTKYTKSHVTCITSFPRGYHRPVIYLLSSTTHHHHPPPPPPPPPTTTTTSIVYCLYCSHMVRTIGTTDRKYDPHSYSQCHTSTHGSGSYPIRIDLLKRTIQ